MQAKYEKISDKRWNWNTIVASWYPGKEETCRLDSVRDAEKVISFWVMSLPFGSGFSYRVQESSYLNFVEVLNERKITWMSF